MSIFLQENSLILYIGKGKFISVQAPMLPCTNPRYPPAILAYKHHLLHRRTRDSTQESKKPSTSHSLFFSSLPSPNLKIKTIIYYYINKQTTLQISSKSNSQCFESV